MLLGNDEGGEDIYVSVPFGGPIYVPDLVAPPTRVPEFQNRVYQELQSLKEELSGDSMEMYNEEISVDELKIIREDELVNKAFEEAFKDDELVVDASQVTEEQLSPRREDDNCASGPASGCSQNLIGDAKAIVSSTSLNGLPPKAINNEKSNKNLSLKGKKKKKKPERKKNHSFDESYIAKVEELARIKQKQEEDKAAVKLHSFNNSRVPGCGANKKTDKIKSLKSGSVSTKMNPNIVES